MYVCVIKYWVLKKYWNLRTKYKILLYLLKAKKRKQAANVYVRKGLMTVCVTMEMLKFPRLYSSEKMKNLNIYTSR